MIVDTIALDAENETAWFIGIRDRKINEEAGSANLHLGLLPKASEHPDALICVFAARTGIPLGGSPRSEAPAARPSPAPAKLAATTPARRIAFTASTSARPGIRESGLPRLRARLRARQINSVTRSTERLVLKGPVDDRLFGFHLWS